MPISCELKVVLVEATYEDALTIANLTNEHNRIYNTEYYTAEDISESVILGKMKRSINRFYIAKSNNTIVGFIEVANSLAQEILDCLTWLDTNLTSMILTVNHKFIEQLVVKEGYQHLGIGSLMYDSLFKQFPKHIFTALILTQPIENKISIKFHLKNMFKEVANFDINAFKLFETYQSKLFLRA